MDGANGLKETTRVTAPIASNTLSVNVFTAGERRWSASAKALRQTAWLALDGKKKSVSAAKNRDAQKELIEKGTTGLEGVNIDENHVRRFFADAA